MAIPVGPGDDSEADGFAESSLDDDLGFSADGLTGVVFSSGGVVLDLGMGVGFGVVVGLALVFGSCVGELVSDFGVDSGVEEL